MTEPLAVARSPIENAGDLGGQARGLMLAGFLAALAGMVDAIGYLRLGHLFVSFMSGNSTQLGVAVGGGDLTEVGVIAELIALFVLGAAAGQMFTGFAGKWHLAWALVAVAVLLAIAAGLATSPEPMVLAMGALSASMQTSREDRRKRHLRYRHAGKTRSGSWGFPDPALNWMDMAGASLIVGRTDCWSDNWRRRVRADRGSCNLGSRAAGLPACGLVGNCTAGGLRTGHRRKNTGIDSTPLLFRIWFDLDQPLQIYNISENQWTTRHLRRLAGLGGRAYPAISEDVLNIDHSDHDDCCGNQRRRQQQAEKSGKDGENDLRRQGQRRRQIHDASLHYRPEDVAFDNVDADIESNHIGCQRQVD